MYGIWKCGYFEIYTFSVKYPHLNKSDNFDTDVLVGFTVPRGKISEH